MADINELEKQISNLPIGYVIEKIINEKKYYYQQWKENGKTKNRCISEEDAKILKPQIEKRKQLQKELKALKKTMPTLVSKTKDEENKNPEFKMATLFGESLLKMANTASQFEQRDCFSKIQDFLKAPSADKVCLVFGLRRTGKTTLLFQLISDLPIDQTAYIKAQTTDNMASLTKDLKKLF